MDSPSLLRYSRHSLARSWKFDRVTRLCRSHIERGGEVGRGKGVVKNTCKVFAKMWVIREYKYRRWKSWKSKERKTRGWIFFFFLLPFPSTIPFYYFFSYSIPCKLRFSRVQSYSFYGREEIQTITPKFFFFCATVERNVFWIIRFSTRQNNPRAVTHFVHTKVEEKSIATIYTVHAFKSNIEGTLVPLFSISKHLYFYQVSTDHHTFLSLPSSSPPDKRARSILTVSKYIFSRCRYRRPRAESFIIDISCQPRGLYTRIIEYPYMPCHG